MNEVEGASRGGAERHARPRTRVGPLHGIRVLDLTHMLAGPYCTWVLGALGAEVTKVEMPGSGDFTRGIAPFAHGESIYFSRVNRNKRSITLNLKQPSGRAALLRIAERTDIFRREQSAGSHAAAWARL